MIIEWQSNIASFAGNHQYWWAGQPSLLQSRVAVSDAADDDEPPELVTGARAGVKPMHDVFSPGSC